MKTTELFGINDDMAVNVEVEELESERQTLICLDVDKSASMSLYESIMHSCLETFKGAIAGSKEADEILVSKNLFGDDVILSGYQFAHDMNTDYEAEGCTKLYDSILACQKKLYAEEGNGYMQELQRNGVKTKGVFVIFSDGQDNISQSNIHEARKAIEYLQRKEIIVAFIAFGTEAHGIAEDLGIKQGNILETDASESDLRRIFTIVSKSSISASKSAKAGNSENDNFFEI